MAGVFGSGDGIPNCNKLMKKVEPLITPQRLRDQYLTGIKLTDNTTGQEINNSALQQYIDNAVSMLEHFLDISISPVLEHVENKDYHFNDYVDWGYFYLNNYPVIKVRSMKLSYFRDSSGNPEVVQDIPPEWIRLQPHDGIIRLIPNARFPANLQVGATGNFFPEILRSDMVPHLWEITYDFGFEDGKVPVLMNSAVANLAAIQALILGGNLVLGAGIASSSISLDGLSQTINTTQSAENSAYSATIKEYQRRVFGATKDDPFAILKILKTYYKGQDMNIL